MPVVFHDPRPPIAEVASLAGPEPFAGMAARARFGMLANGFPDSGAFLLAVEASIAAMHPGASFRHVEKARPPDALTTEQLEVLTGECDLVIAAYGH
jgi:hypothetical protein